MKTIHAKRILLLSIGIASLNFSSLSKAEEEVENHPMGHTLKPSSLLRGANTPSDLTSTDTSLPRKDFVDVASWQSWMKQSDYDVLKKAGVRGIVVKLTESTSYKNPYAATQIAYAKKAGLTVSTYHYSHFSTDDLAKKEAEYYAKYATELGLSKSTLMVNDAEDKAMVPNNKVDPTKTSLTFQNTLKAKGFNNIMHYASSSWVGDTSYLEPKVLGAKNFWVAQYLYGKPSASDLKNTAFAAWQYSSQMYFVGTSSQNKVDVNIDYTGRFTKVLLTQKYIDDATGKTLAPAQSFERQVGQVVTATAIPITGYFAPASQKVTIGTTGTTVTFRYKKKVPLTQKYVDANTGKEIYKSQTSNKGAGEKISVKPRWISGYFRPNAQTITVSKNGNTITFKYKKAVKLTQKYVSAYSGKTLYKTQTFSRPVDKKLTITPRRIHGYNTPSAQSVKMEASGNTLTFKYAKGSDTVVTQNFINSYYGTKIASVKYSIKKIGQRAVIQPKNIAGYYLPKAQTVMLGKKGKTLTFKYKPKKVTVTQKYVNAKTGKTILTQKKGTYFVGRKLTATPKNIANYITPSSKKVTVGAKGVTITFKYTQKKVKLTQRYIDAQTGNPLLSDQLSEQWVNATVTATPKTISGYKSPAKQSVKIGANGTVVTFKYYK